MSHVDSPCVLFARVATGGDPTLVTWWDRIAEPVASKPLPV